MHDTVQILTPPGVAAIAVVRLCGAGVAPFCRAHLTRSPRAGACVHTQLRDGEQIIDDPVAVLVDAQTLDLSLHGGTWVVERAVALARAAGFVDAPEHTPGSVAEEVERDLPRALTREAIAVLLAQPDAWREMLERDDRAAVQRALDDRAMAHLLSPPVVAIVGAPNVGKSTLANQLFGRARSITADLPGTTRDWVGEQANIGGLVVTLFDTPGVRETSDDIEREAITRARSVVARASLVVEVLDATAPGPTAFAGASIIVVNKADRVADAPGTPTDAIKISARTGEGVPALSDAIRRHFGCDDLASLHARCWTARQRGLLCGRIDS
jgi:tRNA modification GTPase